MKDISVVVVTYNPSYKKLFHTIQSIIWQENIDFEIIIADDGSKNFDTDRVESWFKSKGFKNYKFVMNQINQGTLKNSISGWKIAEGKYIKQLSPGDFLYDKNVLEKTFHYMEEMNFGMAFGLAAAYEEYNGSVELINVLNPRDLRPYYAADTSWIKNNYLIKRDYVNGMAYIARRDLLLKYGSKLENRVKYAEDCTYILMIVNNVSIGFIKDYIIWYEYGTGISTSKSSVWAQRISDDNIACFKIIGKKHPEYGFVAKNIITPSDSIFLKLIKKTNNKIHVTIKSLKYAHVKIPIPDFYPKLELLNEILLTK